MTFSQGSWIGGRDKRNSYGIDPDSDSDSDSFIHGLRAKSTLV